jgi:hypothetical protein
MKKAPGKLLPRQGMTGLPTIFLSKKSGKTVPEAGFLVNLRLFFFNKPWGKTAILWS